MDGPALKGEGNWWSDDGPEPERGRSAAIGRAIVVILVAAVILAGLCLIALLVTR